MNIRLIEKEDLNKGLLDLFKEEWVANEITDKIFEDFTNQKNYTYVIEDNDEIIATASLHIQKKLIRDGGKCGLIEEVIVSKNHRNKKLGSKLLEVLVEKAKEEGCYKVILSCSRDNVNFYERNGFYESEITMRMNIPNNY
jgi:glucosamine-phosphate N-acetyltransferase